MKTMTQSAPPPTADMLSLNIDELNIEELESRLELAAALPLDAKPDCIGNSGCTGNGCINNGR